MADLFRSLGPGVTAHYRHARAEDRPWRAEMREGYASRVCKPWAGIDWHFIGRTWTNRDALFVLCSWEDITQLLAVCVARLAGRKYVLWTDTPHLARKRNWWKARVRAAVVRFEIQGARAVMGTGTPALTALKSMGCPAAKLLNFPYFIDVEAYPPRQASAGALRFLSCGRLVPEKGFDMALRALALRGGEFVYRIAGAGPEEARLRVLARALGIEKQVEFCGWLQSEEMRALYAASDVLLHPAWFEPYGVCVLEAMASGLVVVASVATAAAADRIVHGVNGLLHLTGDVKDLARQLATIDFTMGAAARKTAGEWPLHRAKSILESM